jgi:hypothetical protein
MSLHVVVEEDDTSTLTLVPTREDGDSKRVNKTLPILTLNEHRLQVALHAEGSLGQ